jgi:hypothetical protein
MPGRSLRITRPEGLGMNGIEFGAQRYPFISGKPDVGRWAMNRAVAFGKLQLILSPGCGTCEPCCLLVQTLLWEGPGI